jgi:hypothetical protein
MIGVIREEFLEPMIDSDICPPLPSKSVALVRARKTRYQMQRTFLLNMCPRRVVSSRVVLGICHVSRGLACTRDPLSPFRTFSP